jgi:maltose alpha-D-glucosyltransferase/alpha-amylase
MQLYQRGIRRRLAPMLGGDRRRLELAYSLLFTLPGSPVLRYGDEIGMGDDLSLEERNSVRTPMQWANEPQAGFSRARRTFLPVIGEGPFGYPRVNVADQRRDPDSLLNWFERVIRMRKECPEIGWGDFSVEPVDEPSVLALRYRWRNNCLVILHNLSPRAVEVTLREKLMLANLLSQDHSRPLRGGRHLIALEPYGYRWFRVGDVSYLSQQRDY